MGLYVNDFEVKDRLRGKVRFTDDPNDENLMSTRLLRRLIIEAEGQVEHDLSPRYGAPFQTHDGQAFQFLPERPTKELIRTLVELKSVLRVLETDFGTGGVIEGESYMKRTEDRYKSIIKQLLDRRDMDQNQWLYPPLPGLRLNDHNTEADDGLRGLVINTNEEEYYAGGQVNDPSKTWFNVTWDEIYGFRDEDGQY